MGSLISCTTFWLLLFWFNYSFYLCCKPPTVKITNYIFDFKIQNWHLLRLIFLAQIQAYKLTIYLYFRSSKKRHPAPNLNYPPPWILKWSPINPDSSNKWFMCATLLSLHRQQLKQAPCKELSQIDSIFFSLGSLEN